MKIPSFSLSLFWALSVGISGPAFATEQLRNLNEKDPKPRFEVTDRTWPSRPGEASVCLWKDDKLAALSVTIDDNSGPDVEWWLETSAKRNLPLTWFLITGRISGPNRYNLKWEDWAGVRARGHEIESHTVEHLHTEVPGWGSIEREYAESIKQIEAGIPGHTARFLAYPGGKNKDLNDREVAAKYYNGARGGPGMPNRANTIDYLAVNGMSSPNLGEGGEWANLNNLFVSGHKNYRGWAVIVHHLLKDKASQDPYFAFFEEHKSDLWLGGFGEVCRYGQERDTATLTVTENTASRIAFTLVDRMDDKAFDYPLTVKVRLPDGWKEAVASQDGKGVASSTVEHEGARYALVQAVPDRGTVTLSARQ